MTSISAKIILDSRAATNGTRLTTLELVYPRFILAQANTHRVWSRNTSSSRAIPTHKIISTVLEHPVMPVFWGKNQPGMVADEEVAPENIEKLEQLWLRARDFNVEICEDMIRLGAHKQIVNRLLEPWMWVRQIVSSTKWAQFFRLRLEHSAQPEIQKLAQQIKSALDDSIPDLVGAREWHLPYADDLDLDLESKKKVSVARCARVSYRLHDGGLSPVEKDIQLHDDLLEDGHFSPFEHQATPVTGKNGNFDGWLQYRKMIPGEDAEVAVGA